MKYSRKQIDKAGRIITAGSMDALEYAEALLMVDDWRKLHPPVLEILMERLNEVLVKGVISSKITTG